MYDLLESVAAANIEHDLLAPGDRVLVGVSGGADSMALVHVLHELGEALQLRVSVAHLNHRIRGREADLDERFVRDFAARLALECIAERVDVPAARSLEGGSLEEAARRERYDFLERAAGEAGASKIALGHTKDDNVETVLQRIVRGTGLRGLGGIPPKRPLRPGSPVMIIRPLIQATRRQVLDYLAAVEVPYRTDASNADVTYLRNRIRHVLLPQIEAECGPGVREAINRLAENARNQYNLVKSVAMHILTGARPEQPGGSMSIDREKLKATHPEIAIEALRLALEDEGAGQLSYDQCRGLLGMLWAETGTEMSLPGGLILRAEYDRLVVVDPAEDKDQPGREVELPAPGSARFGGFTLSVPVIDDPPEIAAVLKTWGRREEMVDFDKLRLPLTIRARRSGDRFRPLGAPGSRKLHDFFIDRKVPKRQRDEVPIVCDCKGIVWVAGHRIDHRVRVTDGTLRAAVITMKDG